MFFSKLFSPLLTAVITALFCRSAVCHPEYANRIPNGQRVPNPCKSSAKWPGVGHQIAKGGGPINYFGKDFADQNKQWTIDLCLMDSDGDGRLNGEELGDPSCNWTPGSTPAQTKNITHPGICEPIDSPDCAPYNTFLSSIPECVVKVPKSSSSQVSWCPGIQNANAGILQLTITATQLSSQETTYLCQQFTVPSDQDYQIIAWEPVVSNQDMVHHMALFVCDVPNDQTALKKNGGYATPKQCPMNPECSSMALAWTSGTGRRCYDSTVGIPLGKNYYRTVIVQVHYNNPYMKQGLTDSSGIKLYYIPRSRPNDNGMIAIGQQDIAIPPQTTSTSIFGNGFQGDCSRTRLGPYKRYTVTSLYLHLHPLGIYAKVVINKASTGETVTLIDQPVSYEQPTLIYFGKDGKQNVTLEPGDNLQIECRYDSSNRNGWTFFGAASQDEMCFAFIDMYPRPMNSMFQMLDNIGQTDYCSRLATNYGQCSTPGFYQILQQIYASNDGGFVRACSCSTYPAKSCTKSCYDYLAAWNLLQNACLTELNGTVFYMTTRFWVIPTPAQVYNVHSQIALCLGQTYSPPSSATCDVVTPTTIPPTVMTLPYRTEVPPQQPAHAQQQQITIESGTCGRCALSPFLLAAFIVIIAMAA